MLIERIQTVEEFAALKDEWNALLAESNAQSVFLTWEWLYHWWRHFGARFARNTRRELSILCARERGRLYGIAPLCRERWALAGMPVLTKIKFLGTDQVASDFLDFIVLPGREKEILSSFHEYLRARSSAWDVLELGDVEESSPSIRLLAEAGRSRQVVFLKDSQNCPYLPLPGDYPSFLRNLPQRIGHALDRKTRKIELHEDLSFSDDDVLTLDEIFALHEEGFRAKRYDRSGRSSFGGEQVRRFHADIIPPFRENGWLRFYSFRSGAKAVAFLYAFQYRGRLYFYQSGFSRDWSSYSLGTVLMAYCARDIIARGYREFHYLRGNEAYKRQWTPHVRRTVMLVLARRTLRGIGYTAYLYLRDRAKKLLKKRPAGDAYA